MEPSPEDKRTKSELPVSTPVTATTSDESLKIDEAARKEKMIAAIKEQKKRRREEAATKSHLLFHELMTASDENKVKAKFEEESAAPAKEVATESFAVNSTATPDLTDTERAEVIAEGPVAVSESPHSVHAQDNGSDAMETEELANPAAVKENAKREVKNSPPKMFGADKNKSDSSSDSDSDSNSDSDSDGEDVMAWAAKMFGQKPTTPSSSVSELTDASGMLVPVKSNKNSAAANTKSRKKKLTKDQKKLAMLENLYKSVDDGDDEDDGTITAVKSEKTLTEDEVRAILGEDDNVTNSSGGGNYVRRSTRQPSRSVLDSKYLRSLISKLENNEPDVVVLKMKKFLPDPDTKPIAVDAVLSAMEKNTNCEALYIQNFNMGMRDEQVLHLLRVLQNPKCNIWCLNIGETYNVQDKTWEKFCKGLKKTKITHMYASEHTISNDLKEYIRITIRNNRSNHDMHINPDNLDVIIQCTHCWWNPINAQSLRPYLKKRGYEHLLFDKNLQGSKDAAVEATMNGGATGLPDLSGK